MGGRLSVPRGPGGTTEASRLPGPVAPSTPFLRRLRQNHRLILAPLAALTLGSLFFIYSRTTINAAKENARRHRAADGGSISWRNEALRRHGALEKPEERTLIQELFKSSKEGGTDTKVIKRSGRVESNPIEAGLRRARDRSDRRSAEGDMKEGEE